MGNPIFRFTLRHAQAGSLEITEPMGWSDAKLKLERHEEFHSLVEYFEGAFIFYGSNGVDNGGIDFIRFVEQTYGLDATLNIDIEVSFDSGISYEFIFVGLLDLESINELKDNRAQIPIIRDDFWAKFISRKGTPVNLQSNENQDNEAITPVDDVRVTFPSQKVRYFAHYEWGDTHTYYEETDAFGDTMTGFQFDWGIVIEDDVKKFTLPRANLQIGSISGKVNEGSIFGLFEAPFDGDYTIESQLIIGRLEDNTFSDWLSDALDPDLYVMKSNETMTSSDRAYDKATVTCGTDQIAVYNFNKTFRLQRGEQIAFIGRRTSPSFQNITVFGKQRLEYHNVVVASVGPLVLFGEQTIDGIVTSVNDILVKNQPDPADNGIWTTSSGAWTRPPYAQDAGSINNIAAYVTLGDTNSDTSWRLSESIEVVDVDAQQWIFILPNDERLREFPCSFEVNSYLKIYADTTFKTTRNNGFLLHDAAAAILKGYGISSNPFYSEYIGSTFTNARTYASNGCESMYALFKGLQLRGYDIEDKPFFMSFEQWWKGANPILNLGLGYDQTATTPDEDLIRVEKKSHFFTREISSNFDYVFEISREYDEESIFNKIEIGYSNWQSEDISGIDDPQTKRTYATRFKKVGKGIELFSDFIAASLAIEVTRRQTISLSKDYKFDNNTFIVAINPDDTSPDSYLPELDENFASVSNLLNSETRYNLRLTTARNMMRWRRFFNGALQNYLGSIYKFVNGEGNYDMVAQMLDNGCDYTGELSERQNIFVTSDFLHLPHLYTIVINLDWESYVTIREARHKAIGISQTNANHKMFFIKSLEYELVKGKATIKAWPIEYFEITQTDFVPIMRECVPEGSCGTGVLDRITSEGEGRVTSEGECRIIA